MREEKQDRRSQRTRHMLIHALLELIENKHYDQISVQDIVEQANVGRSTFYAHYQNKDELLLGGFKHVLQMLVQHVRLDGDGRLVIDTSPLFSHAQGHYELYRTLLWGSGFELIMQDGHSALSRKLEARLGELLSQTADRTPLPLLSATLAGALLVMLKWWLDHKMPYPPAQMDAYFQAMVMPGIRQTLQPDK